ncbi:glycosyltransferase [uncultured Marivita sp.]|uniref:glycosyltransferase n=1 Tax=uncultured Marivita sp. TaxID=888080 RepID=UPI00262DDB2C|nr:glycosyltransferase [uncultured Marivita sp.]
MRPLRIAVLAHIRHPIAEPFRGGMEAHAHQLVHGLADRGHDVTLFAAGDSEVNVALRPLVPQHYDSIYPWHDFHGTDALNAHLDAAFEGCLHDLAGYDVVHNNALHRFPPRHAQSAGVPMVTSLHVPPFGALQRAVHSADAPWMRYTACSNHLLQSYWPDGTAPRASVVPNGIDTARWPVSSHGNGEAIWAGRITPNKAPHMAAQAIRMAGLRMTIYGVIEHEDYFNDHLRPLWSQDIRYGGHVSSDDLALAVSAASVLMFTPLWDEPFGLVAAEAMVCGTPVAAFDKGGVREVIGTSGGALATAGDIAGLRAAIAQALTKDRASVARDARTRLSKERMLSAYEAQYRAAMAAARRRSPDRSGCRTTPALAAP